MPLTREWNGLFRKKQRGINIDLAQPVDVTHVTDSKIVDAPVEEAPVVEKAPAKKTRTSKKKED